MAPRARSNTQDSSPPLADYFWIAGLDTQQLLEAYKISRWSQGDNELSNSTADQPKKRSLLQDIDIDPDSAFLLSSNKPKSNNEGRDSYQRLSQLSGEARNTILNLDNASFTRSNRSSATIRPVQSTVRASALITDQDFEMAMQKFTLDRDSFFLDLNFNSVHPSKTGRIKSRPRTQRIVPEELDSMPNRGFGSIRRHKSKKEINGGRRPASNNQWGGVPRASARISSYNSVVPSPEVLHSSPDQHPLKRKFEPVLLDHYPRANTPDAMTNRNPFPEYVPMFAFPNDIKVVSADSRPRSTWHEFSMTASDNSKVPAVCVIVYIPVSRQTADELEKRCEEWRRNNMTDAERELAASLGDRLALERAKYSRLLTQLPHAIPGTDARDQLEDQINTVEERITVMTDMLKPLRLGAALKIEGLTDGDTGLWIPRAYGILGRASITSFWRQWLRAVVVPMMDGSVLRVPPSSPRIGMWQPLERYVHTLCTSPSPISSKLQIDLAIRELHLYAKREASNELPGSRTTDLYPLFRALTIPNIVVLMEYVLAESRIILVSAHTAMLQMVSRALVELIWPLQWAGVYIPVLPARLVQTLDAPCPYICGILRSYDRYDLPEDDFVIVDLDNDEIQSTAHPPPMPKQQRRKLMSLLHLAAPHHSSHGVPPGPPAYTMETFPYDAFSAEHDAAFTGIVRSTDLAKLVSMSSTMFGASAAANTIRRAPMLNVFLNSGPTRGKSGDRPRTASTPRQSSQNDSEQPSPPNSNNYPAPPLTPVSRNDSGYALQTSLREKRSGHFDSFSRRNESISGKSNPLLRKASLPFMRHGTSPSNASISHEGVFEGSNYAPSTYAQSTLAASTIMPGHFVQPARNTENMTWVEGHCLQWRPNDGKSTCVLCDEDASDGFYRCSGCGFVLHGGCAPGITVVCPTAFYPDQIRATFARFFASLFYTYKKFMIAVPGQKRKPGMSYQFNMDGFIRSQPPENAVYLEMLRQTQAFNEFIAERENPGTTPPPSIVLFDAIIMAKRNRAGPLRAGMPNMGLGRNLFSRSVDSISMDILSDTSNHQWRIVAAPVNNDKPDLGSLARGRSYHDIITRTPAKLEEGLFRQPDKPADVPQIPKMNGAKPKKPTIRERLNGLNGLSMHAP